MPITIEWKYTDGTAEIWRLNEVTVSKTFIKNKEVSQVNIDPNLEYADLSNNSFPRAESQSEFDEFKEGK